MKRKRNANPVQSSVENGNLSFSFCKNMQIFFHNANLNKLMPSLIPYKEH